MKPSKKDVQKALESLVQKGLLEKRIVDGHDEYRLTEKGKKEAKPT